MPLEKRRLVKVLAEEKVSTQERPVRNRTVCDRYQLRAGLGKLGGTAMTSSHGGEKSFFISIAFHAAMRQI
jgi:hypothetical protein